MSESANRAEQLDSPRQGRIPFRYTVSGTYAWQPDALTSWPSWLSSETIRLDVDGRYPQMTVSGEVVVGAARVHWVAKLSRVSTTTWAGPIWYRHGTAALMPFTHVKATATWSWYPSRRRVTLEFSRVHGAARTRTYTWRSRYFGALECEYDRTPDANPVSAISTCDHGVRPASLACERLSLDAVYRRAGFDTSSDSRGGRVPLSGAGANGTWSDSEMHDAMVAYWSRFGDRPAWSLWVFWAALHDLGADLGGIMFDDIGPNHRQGTAIFTESFVKDPPDGDPTPAAWVARMRFWTAAHEMGHAFNLAHSWQKHHPPNVGTPWIPLANEIEARSFMNYPYNVNGGEVAFFADFEYRFSDQELLFMRHAPRGFVQMGSARWFDDHGFSQTERLADGLRLEVRANRARPVFEFMEPVVLELKLANDGNRPVMVDDAALGGADDLTVIIKRDVRPARRWVPYAQHVTNAVRLPLAPGEARYAPLEISSGLNGNDLADPGDYSIQVGLDIDGAVLVSNVFRLRVSRPRTWEEEILAGDFYTDQVSRAVALGGTRVMERANASLEEVVERMPGSRAALHAKTTLAAPALRDYKVLDVSAAQLAVKVEPAALEQAAAELADALISPGADAAETFGHVGLHQRIDQLSLRLADEGADDAAADCQRGLLQTLQGRGVKPAVLAEIEATARALERGSD